MKLGVGVHEPEVQCLLLSRMLLFCCVRQLVNISQILSEKSIRSFLRVSPNLQLSVSVPKSTSSTFRHLWPPTDDSFVLPEGMRAQHSFYLLVAQLMSRHIADILLYPTHLARLQPHFRFLSLVLHAARLLPMLSVVF